MMCGGHSAEKHLEGEALALFNAHKQEIAQKLGVADIVGEHYTTQVVAGTNYTFKGRAGAKHFSAVLYVPLPHTGQPAHITSAQLH